MADSLRVTPGWGKSRRKDRGLHRYMEDGASSTMEGAHAKERRVRAAARQLVACYPVARALRFIESLRAQIVGVVRAITGQRLIEADHPDRLEDAAQTRFLIERTPAAKEQWIRALDQEAATDLELARDLEAQR